MVQLFQQLFFRQICAFTNVAWIPTLLPCSVLGSLSNSPSACFVSSDGNSLRVYQVRIIFSVLQFNILNFAFHIRAATYHKLVITKQGSRIRKFFELFFRLYPQIPITDFGYISSYKKENFHKFCILKRLLYKRSKMPYFCPGTTSTPAIK